MEDWHGRFGRIGVIFNGGGEFSFYFLLINEKKFGGSSPITSNILLNPESKLNLNINFDDVINRI